jgi:hypothetical protein
MFIHSFIHWYCVSQINGDILISMDIVSIFLATTVHISQQKVLSDDCTVTLKVMEQ